ncbi:MAG: hypothetical protein M1829_005867 [Trizodia sp. TS-e1964]|nr:MAG: hypothetical protein M1829_005867 [Trizodia sp. TS-e1964]
MSSQLVLTAEALKLSQDARRAAIELFASNTISAYAWRDVQDIFNSRRFQFDIVPSLPPELAHLIFQSLGLNDVIRMRKVSTKWRTIFSSEAVCKLMLHQFCPKVPMSMASSGLSYNAKLLQYAQRFNDHGAGHYHSQTRFSCNNIPYSTVFEDGDGTSFEKTVKYADGKIAWIEISPENESFCAIVQHLAVDKRFSIVPDNREELLHLTLSSSIMATISSLGICYMCDVFTGKKQRFRLPSINIKYVSSRKRKIALILKSDSDKVYSVLIHDFDSQKSFTIALKDKIPPPTLPDAKVEIGAVLIDRDGGSFFIFSSYRCEQRNRNGIYMIVTKIGFDGECLLSSSITAPCRINSRFRYFIQPCDYKGNFVIHISTQIGSDCYRYIFNEVTAELSCTLFTRPIGEGDEHDWLSEIRAQTQVHFWDGFGYFLLYADHCILRSTFDPDRLCPHEHISEPTDPTTKPPARIEPPIIPMMLPPAMLAGPKTTNQSLMEHEMDSIESRRFIHFHDICVPYNSQEELLGESSFSMMGDDQFLILFYYNSVVVWCFDSSVKMPEGQTLPIRHHPFKAAGKVTWIAY